MHLSTWPVSSDKVYREPGPSRLMRTRSCSERESSAFALVTSYSRVGGTVSSSLSRARARSNTHFSKSPLSQLFQRGINTCKFLSSTISPSFPPSTIIPFRSRPSNRPLSAHPSPSHAVMSTASACGHVSQSLVNHVRAMLAPSTSMCFWRRRGLTALAMALS